MPHAPQFDVSVAIIAQLPPQSIVPRGQRATHVPLPHASPAGQTKPHAPQFDASLAKFTQTPLQSRSPAGQ